MCPSIHVINKQLIIFYMTLGINFVFGFIVQLLISHHKSILKLLTNGEHTHSPPPLPTVPVFNLSTHTSLFYFMLFPPSVPFLCTLLVPSPIHSTLSFSVDPSLPITLTTHLSIPYNPPLLHTLPSRHASPFPLTSLRAG